MSVSLEYLQRCSAQTGYAVGPLEKVIRLGEMAGEIARHPLLGRVMALKGGTALNICYGPPRRLSVDLDFNYIGHLNREKMLEERPKLEDALIQVAGKKGYQVQQSADAFAVRKFFLIYRSATDQNDRIEMDVNYMFRLPVAGTEVRVLWQPGELDRPKVRVVSLLEILVGKVLAFLDRSAVRDAWDLANLSGEVAETMSSDWFKSWFVALSAVLDHPLSKYTRKRIESSISENAITEQLAPMLMGETILNPKTLVDRSWVAISHLMELTEPEIKFISALQRGELCPELLFPDSLKQARQVANHPAILWKLVNVRNHLVKAKR
jgi:predicted nucleotidyltransferase component of viral defense system